MSSPTITEMPVVELSGTRHVSRETQIFDLLVAASSLESEIPREFLHEIDWDELLRQARHHSLLPLLTHRLLESTGGSLIPNELRDQVRGDFQSRLRCNFGLLEEMKRILATWQNHGIAAMPYKGPALAQQLWGSFALRECSDLDFLVRREDIALAAEVLAEIGYRPETQIPSWLGSALLRDASELQFRHMKSNLLLELQWAPAPRTLAISYDEEELWRNRISVSLAGLTVTAPSPEDLLGLLVIHGWKHNWSKVIWVADVANLLDRYDLDWDRVRRSAAESGWRRILSLGLEMARRVYRVDAPVPVDSGIAALAGEFEHNLRAAADSTYIHWHRDMLRARDSLRQQAKQLANFVFTPGLAEYSAYELPRWAAPAYRFIRLTRVAAMISAKVTE